LVGKAPANSAANSEGLKRVTPGNPGNSFLYKKLSGPGPNQGDLMPRGTSGLAGIKLDAIREWIASGAPRTGVVQKAPSLYNLPPDTAKTFVAPPPPADGVQLHLGPFYVAPSAEREVYSTVTVDLPPDFATDHIEIFMPEGSHHFILYHWTGNNPPPAPGIRDFDPKNPLNSVGIFDRTFVTGTQIPVSDLRFPDQVGIALPQRVTFDLNSHYVNVEGKQSLRAEVYVNIHRVPPGSVSKIAEVLLESFFEINVPPGQTVTAGRDWITYSPLNVFMLSSHMHRHGKKFTISLIRNGQRREQIYESLEWNDPVTIVLNPPLQLAAGDGLHFEATHTNNDKSHPLRFGFSAEDDEMCILLGYYYR
jgi:hypothetical protein